MTAADNINIIIIINYYHNNHHHCCCCCYTLNLYLFYLLGFCKDSKFLISTYLLFKKNLLQIYNWIKPSKTYPCMTWWRSTTRWTCQGSWIQSFQVCRTQHPAVVKPVWTRTRLEWGTHQPTAIRPLSTLWGCIHCRVAAKSCMFIAQS
jgi:hypothetical protein